MKVKKIGEVGVDAGLIMIGDPCYVVGKEKTWNQFVDELELGSFGGNAKMVDGVLVNGTTYGDGTYPVFGYFDNSNRCLGLQIRFDGEEDPL